MGSRAQNQLKLFSLKQFEEWNLGEIRQEDSDGQQQVGQVPGLGQDQESSDAT